MEKLKLAHRDLTSAVKHLTSVSTIDPATSIVVMVENRETLNAMVADLRAMLDDLEFIMSGQKPMPEVDANV